MRSPQALGPHDRRIAVIGTTGSGKTTLAAALAEQLGFPLIELDALYWGPNWTAVPAEDFRARVESATLGAAWIVDGIHAEARETAWTRATTIVWLDYSLAVILWRLAQRTVRRILGREVLWSGNRETLGNQIVVRAARRALQRASPSSGGSGERQDEPANVYGSFLGTLTAHQRRRARFDALFQQPPYAHLHVIRLHSPKQTAAWLESILRG